MMTIDIATSSRKGMKLSLVFCLSILISACGSGGEESSGSPSILPSPPPPVLNNEVPLAQQIDAIVQSKNPVLFPYIEFDTDGDGIIDYCIVGDYNGNSVLEWDDIQMAIDDLCDPNQDGIQDHRDGKVIDRDGDGIPESPFCGTIHIMPGVWVSRTVLDPNIYNKKDDQILIGKYQGLTFKGSGADATILQTAYSRQDFCRYHYETGCGGVCSRESAGYLTISDFTFEGLEPRTWYWKGDCDGDGFQAGDPRETDYTVRTGQGGIVVWNTAPHVGKNVKVRNVKVSKVDGGGFSFGNLENLDVRNISVLGGGSAGVLFSGIANSYAGNIHIENVHGAVIAGGVTIFSQYSEYGIESQMTHDFTLDGIVSRHNHFGIHLAAFGAGGMRDVTIRNFEISESEDITDYTYPYSQWGIYLQDKGCLWNPNGNGTPTDACYVQNVTFDTGTIIGCPSAAISSNLGHPGPDRNYTFRNITFLGNSYGLVNDDDTRQIEIGKMPGTLFENNTVIGMDYNNDGIPDVTHLIRVESDNIIIRDNYIGGIVAPPVNTLLHITGGKNISILNNTFDCRLSPQCQAIQTRNTENVAIDGNVYE